MPITPLACPHSCNPTVCVSRQIDGPTVMKIRTDSCRTRDRTLAWHGLAQSRCATAHSILRPLSHPNNFETAPPALPPVIALGSDSVSRVGCVISCNSAPRVRLRCATHPLTLSQSRGATRAKLPHAPSLSVPASCALLYES